MGSVAGDNPSLATVPTRQTSKRRRTTPPTTTQVSVPNHGDDTSLAASVELDTTPRTLCSLANLDLGNGLVLQDVLAAGSDRKRRSTVVKPAARRVPKSEPDETQAHAEQRTQPEMGSKAWFARLVQDASNRGKDAVSELRSKRDQQLLSCEALVAAVVDCCWRSPVSPGTKLPQFLVACALPRCAKAFAGPAESLVDACASRLAVRLNQPQDFEAQQQNSGSASPLLAPADAWHASAVLCFALYKCQGKLQAAQTLLASLLCLQRPWPAWQARLLLAVARTYAQVLKLPNKGRMLTASSSQPWSVSGGWQTDFLPPLSFVIATARIAASTNAADQHANFQIVGQLAHWPRTYQTANLTTLLTQWLDQALDDTSEPTATNTTDAFRCAHMICCQIGFMEAYNLVFKAHLWTKFRNALKALLEGNSNQDAARASLLSALIGEIGRLGAAPSMANTDAFQAPMDFLRSKLTGVLQAYQQHLPGDVLQAVAKALRRAIPDASSASFPQEVLDLLPLEEDALPEWLL
eukprot:m.15237 g.15237  ORF g.15237 m.15237 type:complete len:523 (+) comp4984_c0_seq1:1736-3304(+)